MSELQREWVARRWTDEEVELLRQCEVLGPSERTKRCRHGDEKTDLQEFAELTGRSIKSVQRKWDTLVRAPTRALTGRAGGSYRDCPPTLGPVTPPRT